MSDNIKCSTVKAFGDWWEFCEPIRTYEPVKASKDEYCEDFSSWVSEVLCSFSCLYYDDWKWTCDYETGKTKCECRGGFRHPYFRR